MRNKSISSDQTSVDAIKPSKMRVLTDMITDFVTLEFLGKKKKRVAVLRLSGVIGKGASIKGTGMTLESMNNQIEKAFEFSKLDSVILLVNSPGGSPVQSELIASRIINLSKEKDVPVYSFVEDVAASGGYWLACAGKQIFASKSSIIGSIGVVSRSFGFYETIQKLGIERRVHTAGKNKSVLDPFMPEKKSDIEIIKKLQLQIHEHFIDYVKTRRGGKLTQTDEILFNGEFWAGETAKEFGLIDGIDDMYSFLKRKYGDKVKIEYVSPNVSWLKKKFGLAATNLVSSISDELQDNLKETEIGSKYDIS